MPTSDFVFFTFLQWVGESGAVEAFDYDGYVFQTDGCGSSGTSQGCVDGGSGFAFSLIFFMRQRCPMISTISPNAGTVRV